MTRTVTLAATLLLVVVALVALAPSSARAEPSKTREQAEATMRMFGSLVIGDYDRLKVRCHRHARVGKGFSWKCTAWWWTHANMPATPFGGPGRRLTTLCRNPAYWNWAESVDMWYSRTRCRVVGSEMTRSGA